MYGVIISSFFIGYLSSYGLYNDYLNRKKFKTEFLQMGQFKDGMILDGMILDGTITSNRTHTIDFKNDFNNIDVVLGNCCKKYNPIQKIDSYNKNNIYRDFKYFGHIPYCRANMVDHWYIKNIFTYTAPNIKFNGINMIFDKNSKIFYNNCEHHYTSENTFICENYIPNNSTVTVFGSIRNMDSKNLGRDVDYPRGEELIVKYIGSKEDVIDKIAFEYYNISNSMTALFGISLILSITGILYFIKK